MSNDTTITTTATETYSGVATDITSNYVNVDWSAYQPIHVIDYGQYHYPSWGGWYPYGQPWIYPVYPTYIPPPQVVTQQIFIPRGLTDAEMDAIAERVAKKVIAAQRKAK